MGDMVGDSIGVGCAVKDLVLAIAPSLELRTASIPELMHEYMLPLSAEVEGGRCRLSNRWPRLRICSP